MSAKVNLTMRVKVKGKDRYVPVVIADNGRIKPDWAVINGKPVKYPGGRYYIDWTASGVRRRLAAGKTAAQAFARQLRKEAELQAIEKGLTIAPDPDEPVIDTHLRISDSISSYLEEIKLSKKPKTLSAYTTALRYFQASCSKVYLEDIERIDMLRYSAFLRDKKGQSPRSVRNKFENVLTFLKAFSRTGIVQKNDWPRFVESEPEVYEREDLDKFFAACSGEEKVQFEFFLMTGMREQEVIYCTWSDINTKHSTVSMRWKPEYNWTPKGYKEREIPIPTRMTDALLAYKTPSQRRGLLFPTESGKPKMDFLHILKAVAKRADLDPADWWLHKFRATFATWHLQAGVDLRTVQSWLGHSDLESTLRYLRPARGAGVQAKVNETFA